MYRRWGICIHSVDSVQLGWGQVSHWYFEKSLWGLLCSESRLKTCGSAQASGSFFGVLSFLCLAEPVTPRSVFPKGFCPAISISPSFFRNWDFLVDVSPEPRPESSTEWALREHLLIGTMRPPPWKQSKGVSCLRVEVAGPCGLSRAQQGWKPQAQQCTCQSSSCFLCYCSPRLSRSNGASWPGSRWRVHCGQLCVLTVLQEECVPMLFLNC